jgi:hypothetical protein
MKRPRLPLAATLAALLAISLSRPAAAAVVHLDFDLLATDFTPVAPQDPVVGRFQLTFDNAADIDMTTSGLVVTGFSLPRPARYAYRHVGDALTIGTLVGPAYVSLVGPADFALFVSGASATYTPNLFAYSDTAGLYFARRITLSPVTAAAPEPSAWALLIAGFAATGVALRTRRRAPRPRWAGPVASLSAP